MLTKSVPVCDVLGKQHDIPVREMTVGEIRARTPDIELVSGMLTDQQRPVLDALPQSEFAKLVAAVVDMTFGSAKSLGN